MTYLKDKSQTYLQVAELLKSAKFFSAIPHSSYYSCLQLMKYQIKNVLGIDYEIQDKNRDRDKIGSHEYIIRTFITILNSKVPSQRSVRDFQNEIRMLKTIREQADYECIVVDDIKYTDTIVRATELRKIITKLK